MLLETSGMTSALQDAKDKQTRENKCGFDG